MALPAARQFLKIKGEGELFATGVVSVPLKTVERTIVHELGADLAADPVEECIVVPPSPGFTQVVVKSSVATQGAVSLRSPAYLGTIRRRGCRALASQVQALGQHETREDFVVCTYPITKQFNALIEQLLEADSEGNSRQALRRLRNTMLNGGWKHYRAAKVRQLAVAILERLSKLDEVEPKDADAVFDQLFGIGLVPIGAPLFGPDEGDESADGEEKVPD